MNWKPTILKIIISFIGAILALLFIAPYIGINLTNFSIRIGILYDGYTPIESILTTSIITFIVIYCLYSLVQGKK